MARFSMWLLILCFLFPAGCAIPPDREPQDIYPYLQMPTASSMTIQWRTCSEKDGMVRYGPTPSLELEAYNPRPVSWHHFDLTDLLPDTEYCYQVYSDGIPIGEAHTFRTAPEEAVPFVFAVLGDTLYTPMEKLLLIDLIMADDPSLLLHVGDMVGEMGGYQESLWREHFFDDFQGLLCRTPLMPVLGNHDYQGLVVYWFPVHGGEQLFRDYFTLPNNERWYSFDWANCHFIALDTNIVEDLGVGGKQYGWLVEDLEAATDGIDDPDRIFVYWHQVAFSSGFGQHDMMGAVLRQLYAPLMEDYGVDVVFYGHDHFYERSYKDGVYYILTGGGGASPFPIIPGTNPHSQKARHAFQYMRVSVSGAVVLLESVDENGVVVDSFTLSLNGAGI